MNPNKKYGLTDSERFSFAAGRRAMCKSVGLKPDSSGCTATLKNAGWEKTKGKDEAIAILCQANILTSEDCSYFQAGGEPKGDGKTPEGVNLGMLFLVLFLLVGLIVGAYFLIKKTTKK